MLKKMEMINDKSAVIWKLVWKYAKKAKSVIILNSALYHSWSEKKPETSKAPSKPYKNV